jgi:hypothetical protein
MIVDAVGSPSMGRRMILIGILMGGALDLIVCLNSCSRQGPEILFDNPLSELQLAKGLRLL